MRVPIIGFAQEHQQSSMPSGGDLDRTDEEAAVEDGVHEEMLEAAAMAERLIRCFRIQQRELPFDAPGKFGMACISSRI